MKHLYFIFFWIVLFMKADGQKNYNEALKQGDDAFNKQEFKIAINKYFAAEAFDPTKRDSVKARVNRAFEAIETLRSEAEIAKRNAVQSELAAKAALLKAQKFMNAFYFYDGKYALILKRNSQQGEKYAYINKEGNEVFADRFEKAGEFEDPGFAKVQIWEGKYGECCNSLSDFLLDTSGKKYRVLYQLDTIPQYANVWRFGQVKLDSIPWDVIALDLRNSTIDSLPAMAGLLRVQLLMLNNNVTTVPKGIGNLIGLKSLYINHAYLSELSSDIVNLKNLQTLDLYGNHLRLLPLEIVQLNNLKILNLGQNRFTSLPKEIKELKNLKWLNLSRNEIPKSEIEKIKKLLPKCKVIAD